MIAVELADAREESRFGGKTARLSAAVRAGLPVPSATALDAPTVDAIAAGRKFLEGIDLDVGRRIAVRSSVVGEDASARSFAGQHLTHLNVAAEPDAVMAALRSVWESARSDAVLAYRRRLAISGNPSVGILFQRQLDPHVAGVLFTTHPMTGARERVIEAGWGLGQAIVNGRITPDRYRLDPTGSLVDQQVGIKTVALRPCSDGGIVEYAVESSRHRVSCLSYAELGLLNELAVRCEGIFSGGLDLEWALENGRIYLLQCRPITASFASVGRKAVERQANV
jgi:pyruvate,water dikinase